MPKMVYVKGVGYVREGSWSTKDIVTKWKRILKQVDDVPLALARLEHLLFGPINEPHAAMRDYAQSEREYQEERLIWKLEEIRDAANKALGMFPKHRRVAALENVTGRTPEEAAAFRAKAKAIRESM